MAVFHWQAGCALQLFWSVNCAQNGNGTSVGVGVGGSISTRKPDGSPEGVPAPACTQQPRDSEIMMRYQVFARLRPSIK